MNNKTHIDPAVHLRKIFLDNLTEPLVLKNFLVKNSNQEKWQCVTWDRYEWTKVLGSEKYKITFGKKIPSSETQDNPHWEHLNIKSYMSYSEILKWQEENLNFTTDNKIISPKEYWAYLDYYYMKNLPDDTFMDQNISWEIFGFPEIKAKDSTLWIGTDGANTPCHIDTYGANIVCQIYGKKRWTLFPKNQASYLYPTRVPYEESSIYSTVGFPNPNIKKFPDLHQTTPFLVILEAGDVLFVPKHWWHFVENLDFSISINAWIPLPNDHHDRLKEAVVAFQVGSLCQSLSDTSLLKSIFVENMINIAAMTSSELLDNLYSNICNYIKEKNNVDVSNESQGSFSTCTFSEKSEHTLFQKVDKYSFLTYTSMINRKPITNTLKRSNLTSEHYIKILINCFTDERVVNQIKNVLDENIELIEKNTK